MRVIRGLGTGTPPRWRRNIGRLTPRLTPTKQHRFPGTTLFDVVGRELCGASCMSLKEYRESWEVARRVLRRHRGGRVWDLAGGHGLVGWLILLLDPGATSAVVVDPAIPLCAHRLREALGQRWPDVTARWTFDSSPLGSVVPAPEDRLVGVHACGGLTDQVLDLAIEHRCRVAVLPCCQSTSKDDSGVLGGWMDADLAIDTTRAHRLRQAGFLVQTAVIPVDITPKNRLLFGTPLDQDHSAAASP